MNTTIKTQVLNSIKPTKLEHENLEKTALKFKRKLKRAANKLNIKCEIFIGGSFGKGTYLKGNSDVDFFCRFHKDYDDSKISSYLQTILETAKIKHKKQKGSRDYYSGIFGPKKSRIKFEAVPVRKIKTISDALNSTDVSPMHVDFVKKHIDINTELSDEIRLTKQFFKTKKLYGAESYIGGFSGHIIDILVIKYQTLENLLNQVKTWNEQKLIDINEEYSNKDEAIKHLNEDKISNLIIIDPIIKTRNAARALSEENYSRFLLIANHIDELTIEDFKIKKENYKNKIIQNKNFAKENNLKCVIYQLRFKIKNDSEDIIGSKLKKLHKKLEKYFRSFDFVIFENEFFISMEDEIALLIFNFEKVNLPRIKKVIGPKVHMRDAITKFLKEKKYYFIEDGRICVYETRRIHKLKNITGLNIEDMHKMLNKNIEFVKKIRIYK